jgi:stearoyl-CoA desaturase (delta-9 desaturase)
MPVCSFILLVISFYLWHIFGEAIGLHRLLSHRSFSCPKWLEYFWVFGAYLAFQGSPIWWVTIHRAHHRHVDTPLDPHAPGNGVFSAYTFYSPFRYADHINPKEQSKDLFKDPIYAFLECGGNWRVGYALNVAICILFRIGLFCLFGWTVAIASLVAGVISLNIPLLLNVICHIPRLGSRNYATDDDSVNVWWMSVLTLGEGWHNNHHAFPNSARAGIKSHEIDLCWLKLCALKKLGLITSVNEAKPGSILKNLRQKSPSTG